LPTEFTWEYKPDIVEFMLEVYIPKLREQGNKGEKPGIPSPVG
jgi:hypothetical protein